MEEEKRANKDVFIPTRSARASHEKINTLTVGEGVLDSEREERFIVLAREALRIIQN